MSQSTIEAALRTLLMEEGRACLPGIGTLVVEAQPALVSLIEGRASPPSKYVSFNANLIMDDGRLRQESGADQDTLTGYLQLIETTLHQDKPFPLPGIGKLYRQDKDGIRFTPGANNLSKGSYGLPAVTVQPIIRKERLGPTAHSTATTAQRSRRATASTSTAASGSVAGRRPTPWPWYLAGVVGVLLAIFLVFRLAGTIGILLEDGDPLAQRARPAGVTPPAVAAQPARPDIPPTPARDLTPEPPPRLADPDPVGPVSGDPTVSETSDLAGNNEAIIYIGLYGRERNVRKQVGRLEVAGYVPYTEREGRTTRVGVRLRYGAEAELRRALLDLRERYTPDAFIAQINGARQRPQ